MSDTPSNIPFSIPELLENILCHSPPRDLIRFQLVSHLWHDTILQSKRIRRALFLDPIPPTTTWLLDDRDPKNPTVKLTTNPPPPKESPTIPWKHIHQGHFNPLLLRRGYFDRYPSFTARLRLGECVVVVSPHLLLPAPYLAMYLTQPPCTELKLWTDFKERLTLRNPTGLTAEDLLRQTERRTVVPFLPHVFVQMAGFVEPTVEEAEGEVGEMLRRGDTGSVDGGGGGEKEGETDNCTNDW